LTAKPTAVDAMLGEALSAWGSAMGLAMGPGATNPAPAGISLPPQQLAQIQADYLANCTALWNGAMLRLQGSGAAQPADLGDKRFASAEWAGNPAAALTAQLYLLNARTLTQLADQLQGDAKTTARVRFAVQQWLGATSPSNFLALNPDALKKALDTGGQSIADGMQMLLQDMQKGHLSQTDESVFEVGRNVATTAGSVVFENEIFQLIEYAPLTAKVHARPMLFVPPCINKFYILDLQPDNSLIRYTVQQGHRTFVISWRNPDESLAAKTWDDYIEQGPIAAIRAVQAITGQPTINTLGFCVGGTILSTALAVLAARKPSSAKAALAETQPAQSVTLLTTLLDFSATGILDIFIDEAAVHMREQSIGAQAPKGPALLKGQELATTFSLLRPNELVWNYVVGNYLKGEKPPAFDLLYWNGDSTNLPGPMYCWYLRHTYLQNELKTPGALTVCGVPVDLGRIQAPAFVYASREDHIVPWQAAYASLPLLAGDTRFVLGASGHIAGVINPPAKGKRCHWVWGDVAADVAGTPAPKKAASKAAKKAAPAAATLHPANAEDWLTAATEVSGSWWPNWAAWLQGHAGPLQAAPSKPGGPRYPVIEPAPGRYVKAKA
jgi:polyhydroxyalkanoate synthase subunit PhaC